jgi:protein-disulfide isomerase
VKTEYVAELTPAVGPGDHIRGRADAPVTLVEYGDFQCPYCGAAYPIVRELEREAGDIVRVVFRNFPLKRIHPQAELAAEAAEAAGAQGKFWEMHDLLYEHQERLLRSEIDRLAGLVGLDLKRFDHDLASGAWAKTVSDQFRSGVISGVNGTPTFFVNGARHDGGYSLDELMTAVKRAAKVS